ncbi:mitochondrial tRNA-specific 2-thiouridylase 1-like [Liolophura sinensis]|uniref:mitochondrial tRNA-specific 2-thiouridylase 1-like n=1 Tax=Liolophura sinensis TaxID=3198878 RepID=UPI0031584325
MALMSGIRRIVCGISGGVDSAVAAFLLKQSGHEVHGLYMRNWDVSDEAGRCTADQDVEDAKFVCRQLQIPFHDVNFVKEYWNDVFSYLIHEYENGRTPNPDILCNKHIKFDAFLEYACSELKSDAIATGHYARRSNMDADGGVKLLKAEDTVKDQTLFLSQISQDALRKTLFPVGGLAKSAVKAIAVDAGLKKIARKKESMGICFIGSRNFHSFIEEYLEPRPAKFIDIEDGRIVGFHKGIHYWTLGQACHIPGQKQRYFVADKNIQTHDILVAPGTNHPALFTDSFMTGAPHWIHKAPPDLQNLGTVTLDFRFQHKHPLIPCTISRMSALCDSFHVTLSQPMRAITPGQFAVFYSDEECLGSAQIETLGPSLYSLNFKDEVLLPKVFS